MNLDEAYKNKIGERLTRRLAQALKNGEINEAENSTIASYILENIDKATNNLELVDFLASLAQKWPIFSESMAMEKEELANPQKEKAIEEASTLIKENRIDEAIKVVESATDQKTGGQI